MTYWIWLVLGGALMVTEVFMPTFVMLWFGTAALVVGGIMAFVPDLAIEIQIFIFSVIALVSVFVWRLWGRHFWTGPKQHLNARAQELVGTTHRLLYPITEGRGRLMHHGILWSLNCEVDIPADAEIYIRAIEGSTLLVEPAQKTEPVLQEESQDPPSTNGSTMGMLF